MLIYGLIKYFLLKLEELVCSQFTPPTNLDHQLHFKTKIWFFCIRTQPQATFNLEWD